MTLILVRGPRPNLTSSSTPLDPTPTPTPTPKDAALLLLELCERELTQEELSQQHLGYSPQVREAMLTMGGPIEKSEAQFTPVQALISHPITALLDGMPI